MANILAALKRHNIYRVAAAYAVVAWVLGQLVGILMPVFDLPQWIARAFLLLLALGFPVAIFFAWANQLAPERGAAGRTTTGKLDWALMGALVVVIALVSYQQLAPLSPTRLAQVQIGVETARQASAAQAGISIVVLPFENLSGDAAQEFFSDGMTEEITAALAKVPDLRVVARTSAFQFKAQNRDIQSIGQQLHASHFIEGSVRKEGNRVRITVQLIKSSDGSHLWAENYDRELTGIFAIQEDIARAIATSLRMPLGLKPGENLVNNRSIDTDSYQQFLRAKALLLQGRPGQAEALKVLESLVARNPDYAPAWARLAEAYAHAIGAVRRASVEELQRVKESYSPKWEAAVRRAIQLDPNSPDANLGQAAFYDFISRRYALAEDFYSKALALDPDIPDALEYHGEMLLTLGRVKEGLALSQRLQALEPFIPYYACEFAEALWLNGQDDAAIAILKDNRGRPGCRAGILPQIYASLGRYREAADLMKNVEDAARLLRTAPAKTAAPQSLPQLGPLNWIYLYIGVPERILEDWEEGAKAGFPLDQIGQYVWHPSYALLRKTERFKNLVRAGGYVDYWKVRGWPEFCHPTTGDDFACD
jgi:adenylate cyclase